MADPLAVNDPPNVALRTLRTRRQRANLHERIQRVTSGLQASLTGLEFTLRHRAPRPESLEGIENSLINHLADVEWALHQIRNMIANRDRPVSSNEWTSHDPETMAALAAGPDPALQESARA